MNDDRDIQVSKWQRLLVFAGGSMLTAIVSTIDLGGSAMGGRSPLLGFILLFWTVFGFGTGAWIVLGQRWRPLAHETRLRLGFLYLAVGWGGLAVMFIGAASDAILLVLVSGLVLALIFVASTAESKMQKQKDDDVFP